MSRFFLFFSLLTLIAVTGCGNQSAADQSTPELTITSVGTLPPPPTATTTSHPEPTNTPVPSDPRNATDNPLVNETISLLLDRNIETLLLTVQFNQQPCTTAQGLGGPPKCSPGTEEGTPVTFLPVLGPGEGAHLEPDEVERIFDYMDPQLIRVILVEKPEVIDEVFPEGVYAVVLRIGPDGLGRTFRLDVQGKIIRVDYTAWPAVQEAEKIEGQVLFFGN